MVPIYEQGEGRGIGHGLKSFLIRFEEICKEHQASGRAKSFAFIFYDFQDDEIRKILQDEGVFARLDRLSGNALSIFYLHASSQEGVERFNNAFGDQLGLDVWIDLPCIAFFKLSGDTFTNIAIAKMESPDLIHGFHELYGIIERYLTENEVVPTGGLHFVRWINSAVRFVTTETLRAAIETAVGRAWF